MKERFFAFFRRMRQDERAMRRVYIGCTVLALALSAGILALMAHGESGAVRPTELPATEPPPAAASPAPNDDEERLPLTVELDDAQAAALVELALRDTLAPEGVEARFSAPDALFLAADLPRDALRELLRSEGQSSAASLLALAPESIRLELSVRLGCGDGGGLEIETRSLSACGLSIGEYLPQSLVARATDALVSALGDTSALKGVEVRDGAAVFTFGL